MKKRRLVEDLDFVLIRFWSLVYKVVSSEAENDPQYQRLSSFCDFYQSARVDQHERLDFLLLLQAKEKTREESEENSKAPQGIQVFSLSPDRQCRASSKWKGKKEMVENMNFFSFSFSMNEHLTCHMMAAQAAKCKGVVVRSNQDREDKLMLNLLSCKCC